MLDIDQTTNSQNTLHKPSRASYGVSLVSILEKNDHNKKLYKNIICVTATILFQGPMTPPNPNYKESYSPTTAINPPHISVCWCTRDTCLQTQCTMTLHTKRSMCLLILWNHSIFGVAFAIGIHTLLTFRPRNYKLGPLTLDMVNLFEET